MIAGLVGKIDSKLVDAVLVDVGGVIFRVGTTGTTLTAIGDHGDDVRLATHLFVREDQLTLYGFATDEELRVFETLITVTGVGPRLACAILTGLPPDRLRAAIEEESVAILSTVPGVGKKTAARLIVELRGKVPAIDGVVSAVSTQDGEAVAALQALGYTVAEARNAVARIKDSSGMTVEERVVAALHELSS